MAGYLIDAFDPRIGQTQESAAAAAPEFEYEPGFFDGSVDAIGSGLGTAATKAALFITDGMPKIDASQRSPDPIDAPWESGFDAEAKLAPQKTAADQESARLLTEQIKTLRPDPKTTGLAGQVLHGLFDIVPRAVIGSAVAGPVGGVAAVGLPEGYASYKVGVSEGLDENTAAIKGGIEGVTTGAGMLIPGGNIVKGALPDLALTIGANAGLGVVQRKSVNALLESRGYGEMAKQYDAWDSTAILTDMVLGAAFWGVTRAGGKAPGSTPKPDPAAVDAALTANNARHLQVESAVGVPADPRSMEIHAKQMGDAIESLLQGSPIRIDPRLADAEFVRGVDVPESRITKQMRTDYPGFAAVDTSSRIAGDSSYVPTSDVAASVAYEATAVPVDGPAVAPPAGTTEPSAGQATNPLDSSPTVQAARQALERYPDMQLRIEDENGNEIIVKASDHIRALSEDSMRQAQTESRAFEAAVTCYLGSAL